MTQSPATFSFLHEGMLLYPQEQCVAAVKVKRLFKNRVVLQWLHEPGETSHGKGSFNQSKWCLDAFDVSETVREQRKRDKRRMK